MLHLILARARELGLKIYTQSELYTLSRPLKTRLVYEQDALNREADYSHPYFEITNVSNYPINLQGFYVTGSHDTDNSMQIKHRLFLQSGESVRVVFSGLDQGAAQAEIHAPFTLEENQGVSLLWPDNVTRVD